MSKKSANQRDTPAFPPVLRDWVIKGPGMSSRACATGHMKDPMPLIEKGRGLSPGGRFPPGFIHRVQLRVYLCGADTDTVWNKHVENLGPGSTCADTDTATHPATCGDFRTDPAEFPSGCRTGGRLGRRERPTTGRVAVCIWTQTERVRIPYPCPYLHRTSGPVA